MYEMLAVLALLSIVMWCWTLVQCVKNRKLFPSRSLLQHARWGFLEMFFIFAFFVFATSVVESTILRYFPDLQIAILDAQQSADSRNEGLAYQIPDRQTQEEENNAENEGTAEENETGQTEDPIQEDESASTDEPTEADEPDSTGEPTDTDKPDGTDEPTEADEPDSTGEPADTDKPDGTDEPADTDKPDGTDGPAEMSEPANTGEPANADEPGHTGKSANTGEPADTNKDAETASKNAEPAPVEMDSPDDDEITEDLGKTPKSKAPKQTAKTVEEEACGNPSYAIDDLLKKMEEVSVVNPLDEKTSIDNPLEITNAAVSETEASVPEEDPLGEQNDEEDAEKTDSPATTAPENAGDGEFQSDLPAHPIATLLSRKPSLFWFLIFCTAFLTPITEEFIFRLVLQGGLESYERARFTSRNASFSTQRRKGWLSMLIVALLFAALHYRPAVEEYVPTVDEMQLDTACAAISNILLLLFGGFLLRFVAQASWRNMGLDFRYFLSDIKLGAKGFLLFLLPTYILQIGLPYWFNNAFVPDPIALLPVSFAFGLMYWKTRRLLPSIVAHALLNGSSLLMVIL